MRFYQWQPCGMNPKQAREIKCLFVILDAASDGNDKTNLSNVRKLTTKSSRFNRIAYAVSRIKYAKVGCEGDQCK